MASYLVGLTQKSLRTFWDLIVIMIPIMVGLRVADQFGVIEAIGPVFEPVMGLINLPAETAIVFITSALMGVYGATATLPVLVGYEMTAAQVTSICLFILIVHNLPIEQAIVRKAGGSFWGTVFLRISVGFLSCWLIELFSQLTGYLSAPQSIDHFKYLGRPDVGHLEWALSSFYALGLLFGILLVLMLLLDILDSLKITNLINKMLNPILRLSGLDPSVTPITTTGVLLGLSYGGGLIIAKAKDSNLSRDAKFYSLCWLSLCHSLIEDTAIMVALGGDIWMLLVGRLLLTFVVIRLIMLWFDKMPFGGKRVAQDIA